MQPCVLITYCQYFEKTIYMQRKYHCINFVNLPSQLHQNPYICMIWKPLICPHTYYLFIQKNWKIHAHMFKCNWNFFHIFQHSNCVQKQHSLSITVFLHSTNKFTPSISCMFPLIYTPAIILPFVMLHLKHICNHIYRVISYRKHIKLSWKEAHHIRALTVTRLPWFSRISTGFLKHQAPNSSLFYCESRKITDL